MTTEIVSSAKTQEDLPTNTTTIDELLGLQSLESKVTFTDPQAATLLDQNDLLAQFRQEFSLPTHRGIEANLVDGTKQDQSCIYFVGNSLGPLSHRSRELLKEELDVWSQSGVNGHFKHPHGRDWMTIASKATAIMASLVGAKDKEVACMGTLTANLHLMMNSFYKPTSNRYKVLCEAHAFPSDQYAFASQAALHGYDPKDAIIEMEPRSGEFTLREEDILDLIQKQGSVIALVMFSGVQYYTGQLFPIEKITKAGHDQGCIVGWDLAHAVGNVPLELHSWDIDFAVWCTYKYLNSGPGGIGGLFVHDKWTGKELPRYAGWWGHNESTRFHMPPQFDAIPGAQGYQQSNPSAINIASLLGSLEIFQQAGGIKPIRAKSIRATAYLEALLKRSKYFVSNVDQAGTTKPGFTIITPDSVEQRGTQLSLLFLPTGSGNMVKIFDGMTKRGVIGDERNPDVIRLAPVPLYCTFSDCKRAVEVLEEAFGDL